MLERRRVIQEDEGGNAVLGTGGREGCDREYEMLVRAGGSSLDVSGVGGPVDMAADEVVEMESRPGLCGKLTQSEVSSGMECSVLCG